LLSEMFVGEIVIAREIEANSREIFQEMMEVFRADEMEPTVTQVPHDEFKELTRSSEVVVRTGECTPYANVILKSGVVF
jgi:D-ribose pyranase